MVSDQHVLWGVIEEHLEEAEYACEALEAQLDHAVLRLAQVEQGIEARLDAHVDGLVIGGELVAERLLSRALADGETDPWRITAAALTLMRADQPKLAGEALLHPAEHVRRAALRGIMLATSAPLEAWAHDRFRERRGPDVEASLLPLIAARLSPEELLAGLKSEHVGLLSAAVRAVALGPSGSLLSRIEALLEHESNDVRRPALLAGLAWGSSTAWRALRDDALGGDPDRAPRMALYAALSGVKQAELIALLDNDALRGHVLFALGFSGSTTVVLPLLEHLQNDARHAKLAAQSLYLITGLDTEDDAYSLPPAEPDDASEAAAALPELEEDDLDASLLPIPEDTLARPNAAAIKTYWQKNSAAFSENQRYLLGEPLSVSALLSALDQGRMRTRHVLAQTLGIRTAGQCWLDTRALPSLQRKKLSELATLQLRSFARQFGG